MVKLFNSNKYAKGTKVYVEGDSSVGMAGFEGKVVNDYDDMVGVEDEQGGYDEYPKRFVWSEKELQDNDTAFHKALKKNRR